jgi:hypothetical protein
MRITKDDILSAIGFETKRSGYIDMTLMFCAGILAGCGIGLLMAPKTGVEMRHDLLEKTGDLRGRANELVSNVKSKLMNKGYDQMGTTTTGV